MKKISLFFILLLLVTGFLSMATNARAVTPTLSISTSGQTGDYVQLSVTGDPNASVTLFINYYSISLGNLNSNGTQTFSIGSSLSENNVVSIAPNTMVYVKTGGINGTPSSSVSWPYVQNSTTTSNLTLSQSALLLNAGQTSTITASASYLYLLSNSNPSIANVNFNGSQITVQALTYGSTTANICIVGSTTNCASLSITVQNSSSQQLSFSQNNFSIVSGQSTSVTVTGGSGVYTISNNSNSSSIQTSLSGSVVTLTATSTTGAASITICTTDMSDCGIINVSSTAVNSSSISFSQTNPVVPIGQSTTVTIYGGTGSNFYVSSNSNPSIVQANITGNILTLIGSASTGTSSINICAYAGTCASLTANVSNTGAVGGGMALSQSSVSILAGQSSSITISGGSTPYSLSSPSAANIFNGFVSGNILTIYGVNPGTATANVCSSAGCTALSVTVSSTTSSTTIPSFSQNNILLNIGQQTTVYISGSGSFYVANNSYPNVASISINGSSVVVTGSNTGSTSVAICQNGGQCATLYITVNTSTNQSSGITLSSVSQSVVVGLPTTFTVYAPGFTNPSYSLADSFSGTTISNTDINSSGIFTWTPSASDVGVHNVIIYASDSYGHSANTTSQITVTQSTQSQTTTTPYVFTRNLKYNDKGSDVLELQKILVQLGFMTAAPTGHYGPATVTAVKKLQAAHGIRQLGSVGPATEAYLNQLQIPSTNSAGSSTTDTSKQQKVSAIEQVIQQLEAQISALQ